MLSRGVDGLDQTPQTVLTSVPTAPAAPGKTRPQNSTLTLVLMCSAMFMIVLDFSIVNVALPSIQRDLHFSNNSLQWPVTAYALFFGGFMLLGGRVADFFGGRRVFLAGLGLFTLASLAGGLASQAGVLVAARSFQGLGAALLAPTVFSLVTTTTPEGLERNQALGLLSTMAAAGFSSGVVLGGLLTTLFGWRAVMIVNVPLGVLLGALAPAFLPPTRPRETRPWLDWPGGLLATAGLLTLIFAVTRMEYAHLLGGAVAPALLLTLLLLGAFVWVERRVPLPLIPFRFYHLRQLVSSNIALALASGSLVPLVFTLTWYTQNVLGYNPWQAGLTLLPQALVVALASRPISRLTTRWGVKPGMLAGALIMAVGAGLLSRLPEHGRYLPDILPGTLLVGLGLAFTNVTTSIAATTDVHDSEQGIAGGLLNTARQVGAALGLAAVLAVAGLQASRLSISQLGPFHQGLDAWLAGLRFAVKADMGLSLLSLLLIGFLISGRRRALAEKPAPGCEEGFLQNAECRGAQL